MSRKKIYKTVDLFGNETVEFCNMKVSSPNLFNDYEGFLDKLEPKKTTDDCYTPKEVYDVILEYVSNHANLQGKRILRPFYPGGDYTQIEYQENDIVIDNPPFSIITKICKYYLERNIKFFLFGPHLTAFSSNIDCTHIITSSDITYENGATIKTAFLSNMFGDVKIIGDHVLREKLKEVNDLNNKKLPKYIYPNHIITVSKIAYCVERGVSISIDKSNVKHYRRMDAQVKHGKALFGSGFLVSDKAAAEAAAAVDDNVIVWELSEKEMQIIKSLGSNTAIMGDLDCAESATKEGGAV